MKQNKPVTPEPVPQSRSWIRHSRHHTDRNHQINVKLSGEADRILRDIATQENLKLYEVIEKVLAYYHQNHH